MHEAAEAAIPFAAASVTEEEISAVTEVLRSGWLTTGDKARKLEHLVMYLTNADAAVATSSCTAALELALRALEIGRGDTVVLSPLTFVSAANVVEHVGARLQLADVDPPTLNMTPEALAAAGRFDAVMPVHYAGLPFDARGIGDVARHQGAPVLQDAAHALGAHFGWAPVGGPGQLAAFSFYATKNATTAEGGMLVGPSELIDRARRLSLHGMSRGAQDRYRTGGSPFYSVDEPGLKANLPDVLAAIGVVQLRRFGWMQRRRHALAGLYRELLSSEIPELRLPSGFGHAWHLYAVRVPKGTDRNGLIERMAKRGIGTSVHFVPVHEHPYYAEKYGWSPEDFPVAHEAFEQLVSLPLWPDMTVEQVERVVRTLKEEMA